MTDGRSRSETAASLLMKLQLVDLDDFSEDDLTDDEARLWISILRVLGGVEEMPDGLDLDQELALLTYTSDLIRRAVDNEEAA